MAIGRVTVTQGTEGPSYDPYSYRELSFESWRNNHQQHDEVSWCLGGLRHYVEVNGKRVTIEDGDMDPAGERLFKDTVGLDLEQFAAAYDEMQYRCPTCGRHGNWKFEHGMPGETFQVCGHCGSTCDTQFDESAIL